MKKASTLIAVFAATAMMAATAGCSGGNTPTSSNTQSVQETTEKTTEKATEKPTEPPTEKPTEDMKNTAYQAYLEYMQDHPEWFLVDDPTFSYVMDKKPIALWDFNGDGIDELIHYRPRIEEKTGEINLCIVTYNNSVQTLYDEVELSIPGAEAGFSVFIGDDNKMYSVTAKELNGHVIRFDMNGTNLSAQTLADSQAHHLAEPEEAVCHIDGKDVSYEEFNDYRKSVEDKVKTYLLINYQISRGVDDVSMSYSDACNYLEKQIKTESNGNNSTQSSTVLEDKSNSSLENGLWIKYSPQAALFETYEFSDGVIERKEYSYENGSISEFNSDNTYAFMTYKADDNSVTIRDDKSNEWIWYFSDDGENLERTYQDTLGGTDTYTVTEKMYHHASFPSYETVKEQSKKRG